MAKARDLNFITEDFFQMEGIVTDSSPKEYDGVRKFRNGAPIWEVTVFMAHTLLSITIPSDSDLSVDAGTRVKFEGLRVGQYSNDKYSGFFFHADAFVIVD